jgi:hypothetical protein
VQTIAFAAWRVLNGATGTAADHRSPRMAKQAARSVVVGRPARLRPVSAREIVRAW